MKLISHPFEMIRRDCIDAEGSIFSTAVVSAVILIVCCLILPAFLWIPYTLIGILSILTSALWYRHAAKNNDPKEIRLALLLSSFVWLPTLTVWILWNFITIGTYLIKALFKGYEYISTPAPKKRVVQEAKVQEILEHSDPFQDWDERAKEELKEHRNAL